MYPLTYPQALWITAERRVMGMTWTDIARELTSFAVQAKIIVERR